jgi:uncharacterized protein
MKFELPKIENSRADIKWLWGNTLFLTTYGSHAYGTNIESSDFDYRGFCVPPKEYIHGFHKRFEQAEFHTPYDMCVFNIQKFFKLATDGNPSVLEILFTSPENHQIVHPLAANILKNRDIFLSTKVKFTFSGYAMSQLKRIKSHRKWIDNPPAKQPDRQDFGLAPTSAINKNQLDAANSAIFKTVEGWDVDFSMLDDSARIDLQLKVASSLAEQGIFKENQWTVAANKIGLDANFIDLIDKEKKFAGAANEWRSYNTWLTTRNSTRSELEKKFKYDTKHGMHLVRLLRMGREILEGKGVLVKRPDAEELLSIRSGAWSYEELVGYAETQGGELDSLYKTSPLPKSPDILALDKLLVDTVEAFYDHSIT